MRRAASCSALRAQQAADMIGAERRDGAGGGHGGSPAGDGAGPVAHGADHGLGLFGDQRVAGVGDHNDGDSSRRRGRRGCRRVCRRGARGHVRPECRAPGRCRRSTSLPGGVAALAARWLSEATGCQFPSQEEGSWPGAKKAIRSGGEAHRVGQGGVDAFRQLVAQSGVGGFRSGGGEDDAADEVRMVGSDAAADPLAEGVAEDEGGTAGRRSDHHCDVAGVIVQGEAIHRAGAAAHASGLRAEHAETRRPRTCRTIRRKSSESREEEGSRTSVSTRPGPVRPGSRRSRRRRIRQISAGVGS